jgi:U3 small nucleolar RNA-associated protein 20
MVDHLGHRLQPVLPCLLALTLRLLEEAVAPVAAQQGAKAAAQEGGNGAEAAVTTLPAHEDKSRELRSTGLRLLANLWLRFPTAADYNDVWPVLLPAVEPLMARLPTEASAEK